MRRLIKVICFLILFFIGLLVLGDVVRPKREVEIAVDNYHDERSGFYKLPKIRWMLCMLGHLMCFQVFHQKIYLQIMELLAMYRHLHVKKYGSLIIMRKKHFKHRTQR